MIRLLAALAAVAALAMPAPSAADDWPEFLHPPQSTVQVVSADMIFNGVPMRIETFKSQSPMNDVVDFYKRRWKRRNMPEPTVTPLGEWKVVGMIDGKFFKTAQVKKDGDGSMGHLGITLALAAPAGRRAKPGEGVPMPEGSSVVNDIVSFDPPKRARTVILTNQMSLDENIVYYLKRFQTDGWSVLQRKKVKDPEQGAALVFRKGTEEASIAMLKKFDKTVVFLNTVNVTN